MTEGMVPGTSSRERFRSGRGDAWDGRVVRFWFEIRISASRPAGFQGNFLYEGSRERFARGFFDMGGGGGGYFGFGGRIIDGVGVSLRSCRIGMAGGCGRKSSMKSKMNQGTEVS